MLLQMLSDDSSNLSPSSAPTFDTRRLEMTTFVPCDTKLSQFSSSYQPESSSEHMTHSGKVSKSATHVVDVTTQRMVSSSQYHSSSEGIPPLTVQPSKSPLKMSTMTTVIDSQITRSDRSPSMGGAKWRSFSVDDDIDVVDTTEVDDDDDDNNGGGGARAHVTETLVEPLLTTITRQPVSRSIPSELPPPSSTLPGPMLVADSVKWDSFSEDASASESVHSTSSSHTVVEGTLSTSQEMVQVDEGATKHKNDEEHTHVKEDFNDGTNYDIGSSLSYEKHTNKRRRLSTAVEENFPTNDESCDSLGLTTTSLDMSVESGESSDTITTSLDSTQLLATASHLQDKDTRSMLERRLDLDDRGLSEKLYGPGNFQSILPQDQLQKSPTEGGQEQGNTHGGLPGLLQEAMGDNQATSQPASYAQDNAEEAMFGQEDVPESEAGITRSATGTDREHSPSSSGR